MTRRDWLCEDDTDGGFRFFVGLVVAAIVSVGLWGAAAYGFLQIARLLGLVK